MERRMEKEVERRRNMAWRKFWAIKQIFRSKLSIEAKISILERCVIPVMIYGAQTWSTTKLQTKKLQVAQRKMERMILGIRKKEKITNTHVRKITKIRDIGYMMKKSKFTYAGHMMRGNPEKWNYKTTVWTPYNRKRRKGRPGIRWREEISGRVGTKWHGMTGNRKVWSNIGEAYAQLWVKL